MAKPRPLKIGIAASVAIAGIVIAVIGFRMDRIRWCNERPCHFCAINTEQCHTRPERQ